MGWYIGAPDECNYHWAWGDDIVKLNDDGSCPKENEHIEFGPGNWM